MDKITQTDVRKILDWYEERKRVLPWRKDRDPYRIWISEIMLQQTRIETVIPYYERFLKEVPDIASLASIGDDRLHKLWEGLGYYSRAKNLKKAAQTILEKHSGVFPHAYEEILSLPGIGPYTAGAIASLAFDEKTPAIDGNVLRVFARWGKEERTTDDPTYKRELEEMLKEVYPEKAGDFTSALMEIGETVCLPNTSPLCDQCPLSSSCRSHADHTEEDYPHMPLKKKAREEKRTVLLFVDQDRILIRKRPPQGLLAGLWEFPNIEGHPDEKELKKLLKLPPEASLEHTGSYVHRFSHIHWYNEVWIVKNAVEEGTWVSFEELEEEIALPTAFRPCVDILKR